LGILQQYAGIFPNNLGDAFQVAQQAANAGFGPFAQQVITMATGAGATPPAGVCNKFPGVDEISSRFPGSTATSVINQVSRILAGTDVNAITGLISQLVNFGGMPTVVGFAQRRRQALQSGDQQAADRVVQEMCLPASALVEPPPGGGPPGPAPPVPTEEPPGPPSPPPPTEPPPTEPPTEEPKAKKKSNTPLLVAGAILLGIAVIAIGGGG